MFPTKKTVALLMLFSSSTLLAQTAQEGRVIAVDGHAHQGCALVLLKKADNSIQYFRIPKVEDADQILAVSLTALTSRLPVKIMHSTQVVDVCGPETKIDYITIKIEQTIYVQAEYRRADTPF